jgi:hypothetical protein
MKREASRRAGRRNGRLACLGTALGVLLLAMACREDVVAAKGFTEAKMLALPSGSSQQEVLGILGEPLDRWNHWDSAGKWDAAYWSYRKRTTSIGTHHAVLIFSPDGRLRGRELEWYED